MPIRLVNLIAGSKIYIYSVTSRTYRLEKRKRGGIPLPIRRNILSSESARIQRPKMVNATLHHLTWIM